MFVEFLWIDRKTLSHSHDHEKIFFLLETPILPSVHVAACHGGHVAMLLMRFKSVSGPGHGFMVSEEGRVSG